MQKTEATYADILGVRPVLSLIKNRGLSVQSLTNLVRFKAECERISDEYYKIQKEIMDKFEVKETNGVFNLEGNPKAQEVQAEVKALQESSCRFEEKLNFMSWKEIHSSTEDLPLDVLAIVAKWLAEE